jgi:hypothetical protein
MSISEMRGDTFETRGRYACFGNRRAFPYASRLEIRILSLKEPI